MPGLSRNALGARSDDGLAAHPGLAPDPEPALDVAVVLAVLLRRPDEEHSDDDDADDHRDQDDDAGDGAGGIGHASMVPEITRVTLARVIVDTHNDLLAELVHRDGEELPFARYWRPELDAGGVGLQVCAIYTADDADDALRFGLAQAAAYPRLRAQAPELVPGHAAAGAYRGGRTGTISGE